MPQIQQRVDPADDDPGRIVIEVLQRLIEIAPAGFAIGLHIRFMTPCYMFETYPQGWRDIYGREGLLMRDPTVHWAMHNHGAVRWSDLQAQDEAGVLARARGFGITHGHTRAIHEGEGISFGGFARADRDFTTAEIDEVGRLMQRMQAATHRRVTLGTDASARIHEMAVILTERAD